MAVTVVPKGSGELGSLLSSFHKKYGDSIGGKGVKLRRVKRVPTGIFPLDLAMGGGFPQGRLSIVYGPYGSGKSNLALLACRHVQTHCAVCDHTAETCICADGPTILKAVYIDAEHTYDSTWAAQLGVDNEEIVLLQPEYAEQASDLIEAVLHANDVGIVILDSVAALTTTAMVDNSTEKAEMGGSALVMSKLVKKATVALSHESKRDHHPVFLCINQVRVKLGVMYGDPECLHADTLVNFVDGRSLPIRTVVEEKIDAPIWAYNENSGEFIVSRILSHHYNGRAKDGDFLTVTSSGLDTKNGVFSATVTYTHKFLTEFGWKTAQGLKVGDLLLTKYRSVINGDVRDFLSGALCGDTTIKYPNRKNGGNGTTAYLQFQDKHNEEYAEWKAKLLSEAMPMMSSVLSSGATAWKSSPTYDLARFATQFGGVRHPRGLFDNFSWLGFAIWMMDDGHYNRDRYTLSVGRFRCDSEVKNYISEELTHLGLAHSWNNKNIVFSHEASRTIVAKCSEYFPPCMHYKLPNGIGGAGLTSLNFTVKYLPAYVPVLEIVPASKRKYRDRGLYDLHIEGHHNYLAGNMDNGFVVHNSMPGGNALPFASSMTVRIYGKEKLDKEISDVLPTFKETSVIIKKWKVPIVSKSCTYDLCVLPHEGLGVGDVDDWNTVSNYLKTYGVLGKTDKNKWTCVTPEGEIEEFQTLTAIRTRYDQDADFNAFLKNIVVSTEMKVSGITEGGSQ